MAASLRRPCKGHGPRYGRCPNLLPRGVAHCEECAPYVKQEVRRYDRERNQGEQRTFLNSAVWRKVREMKRRRDPLCERHLKQGVAVAAALVHHINRDETDTYEGNLESLCTECHEEEHKGERFGRTTHG